MKSIFFFLPVMFIQMSNSFCQTTANDGDWSKQLITMQSTQDADYSIRVGDIDNLGFGWAEGFNPFSGKSTNPHGYPWDAKDEDASGTDRILLGTGYHNTGNEPCGGDGYSGNYGESTTVRPIVLPLQTIASATVNHAALVLFIDDFQSPTLCSKFQCTLNGKRFIEAEKIFECSGSNRTDWKNDHYKNSR